MSNIRHMIESFDICQSGVIPLYFLFSFFFDMNALTSICKYLYITCYNKYYCQS